MPREPRFADMAYQPRDVQALLAHWEDKRAILIRTRERHGDGWRAKNPEAAAYADGQFAVVDEIVNQLHRLTNGSLYSQRKRRRGTSQ